MDYVGSYLQDGEKVLDRSRLHWIVYFQALPLLAARPFWGGFLTTERY